MAEDSCLQWLSPDRPGQRLWAMPARKRDSCFECPLRSCLAPSWFDRSAESSDTPVGTASALSEATRNTTAWSNSDRALPLRMESLWLIHRAHRSSRQEQCWPAWTAKSAPEHYQHSIAKMLRQSEAQQAQLQRPVVF